MPTATADLTTHASDQPFQYLTIADEGEIYRQFSYYSHLLQCHPEDQILVAACTTAASAGYLRAEEPTRILEMLSILRGPVPFDQSRRELVQQFHALAMEFWDNTMTDAYRDGDPALHARCTRALALTIELTEALAVAKVTEKIITPRTSLDLLEWGCSGDLHRTLKKLSEIIDAIPRAGLANSSYDNFTNMFRCQPGEHNLISACIMLTCAGHMLGQGPAEIYQRFSSSPRTVPFFPSRAEEIQDVYARSARFWNEAMGEAYRGGDSDMLARAREALTLAIELTESLTIMGIVNTLRSPAFPARVRQGNYFGYHPDLDDHLSKIVEILFSDTQIFNLDS